MVCVFGELAILFNWHQILTPPIVACRGQLKIHACATKSPNFFPPTAFIGQIAKLFGYKIFHYKIMVYAPFFTNNFQLNVMMYLSDPFRAALPPLEVSDLLAMFSADQAELLRLVAGGGGGGRGESEDGGREERRGREEGREDATHATLKMHLEAMTFDTSTGV